MPLTELKSKYIEGTTITLQGYTSTTLNKKVALKFAFDGVLSQIENPDKCPLLIDIRVKGSQQLFSLFSEELTAYPIEEEVLLQDGADYLVISNTETTETFNIAGKSY